MHETHHNQNISSPAKVCHLVLTNGKEILLQLMGEDVSQNHHCQLPSICQPALYTSVALHHYPTPGPLTN